jgi:hypothetical protein
MGRTRGVEAKRMPHHIQFTTFILRVTDCETMTELSHAIPSGGRFWEYDGLNVSPCLPEFLHRLPTTLTDVFIQFDFCFVSE